MDVELIVVRRERVECNCRFPSVYEIHSASKKTEGSKFEEKVPNLLLGINM